MNRKICVITGSRAEYGLLRWVMQGIKDEPSLTLQIIATGMHLSAQFGNTYKEIEGDGFAIDRKVQMLTGSDTGIGIAKSMGNGMIGFADALNELQPDLIVVLGDRFEIFSAVSAALVARIPVAHIHGGELTEGNFDDALRHSITKMSHLHFVAAEEYQNRVIQLGESPDRVFNVGGLGVDNIARTKLISKDELERELQFKFQERNLIVTFHPVTLETDSGLQQLMEMLEALDSFPDIGLIFTMPNADTSSQLMASLIEKYVKSRDNAASYSSLGVVRYLSALACVDGVIGNSSSGLLEAPILKKGTINIGDRQRGRLTYPSVINCEGISLEISKSINTLYSDQFQESLICGIGSIGLTGSSDRIVELIKGTSIEKLVTKTFYDMHFESFNSLEIGQANEN